MKKNFRSEHAQVIAHGTDAEIRDHLDRWCMDYPQDALMFQAVANCSRLTSKEISAEEKARIKNWLSVWLYQTS